MRQDFLSSTQSEGRNKNGSFPLETFCMDWLSRSVQSHG